MKEYYVLLTGSKNNAGDFLIKHRAKELFAAYRSDREIVDLDRWIAFDEEKLSLINRSKALILTGGPALQSHMYPNLFKMCALEKITVPIILMGLGWSSKSGNWEDTYSYTFSPMTHKLLQRVEHSGYLSSVRDYHSLNALHTNGYKNILMSGCPAYYSTEHLHRPFENYPIRKVAFSLGVAFNHSPSMEALLKENILKTKEYFAHANFEAVFHHSLKDSKRSDGVSKSLFDAQMRMLKWLEEQQISYVDISGSAQNLINYYSSVDLHIGYRVHAHIFMNSISRYTILLNEDGRGKSIKNVIGGITIDAYKSFDETFLGKKLYQLFGKDRYTPNKNLTKEIYDSLDYEHLSNWHRYQISRANINANFNIMLRFLEQLP